MIYEETCETRWKVLPQQFCWLVYEPSLHDTVDISQGLLKCGFLHPAMPFSWLVVSNSQTFYGNWDDMVFHGWTYGMDLLSTLERGDGGKRHWHGLKTYTFCCDDSVFPWSKTYCTILYICFSGWTSIISYPKVVSNQAFPMVFPMLSGWLKTDGYLSSLGIHRSISTRIQPLHTDPASHWGAKLRSALPLLGSEVGFSKVTRALGVQVPQRPTVSTVCPGAEIWSSQALWWDF